MGMKPLSPCSSPGGADLGGLLELLGRHLGVGRELCSLCSWEQERAEQRRAALAKGRRASAAGGAGKLELGGPQRRRPQAPRGCAGSSGFLQHISIPRLPWECRAGQLGVQGSCRKGCTGCPRPHSTSVGLGQGQLQLPQVLLPGGKACWRGKFWLCPLLEL